MALRVTGLLVPDLLVDAADRVLVVVEDSDQLLGVPVGGPVGYAVRCYAQGNEGLGRGPVQGVDALDDPGLDGEPAEQLLKELL